MRWRLELLVNEDCEPVQATVTVLQDGEPVRITTQHVEPFYGWEEALRNMLRGLPEQLRLC